MTEAERDAIREAIDLTELVSGDVELRRRGDKWWGLCPFHEERTPSLMVDPQSGHFHCFGCQAHGDAFDYVMRTRGMTFPEAAEHLAGRAGIELSHASGKGDAVGRARAAEAVSVAMAHARHVLADPRRPDATRARDWLARHGLGAPAIERWEIGYAPGGGELSRSLREAGFSDAEARAAGVLGPRGDRLYRAACVAVTDAAGRESGMCGQVVDDGARTLLASTRRARRSPTPLFTDRARDAIRNTGVALVTDGPIGAALLGEAGIANAVSTMGGSLGPQGAKALVSAGAHEIVLLYPGDTRGEAAALATVGSSLGVPASVTWAPVGGPDTLDALLLAATTGTSAILEAAADVADAVIGRIASRHDLADPQGILACAEEACSALRGAADGDATRAAILSQKVADRLGICDPATLERAMLGDGPVGTDGCRSPARATGGASGTTLTRFQLPIASLARASVGPETEAARDMAKSLSIRCRRPPPTTVPAQTQ